MEDVLDIYKRPYDAKRPVVCMDETNKQLIKETFIHEVAKWNKKRDSERATIDWLFTTKDARVKLKRLYPVLKPIGQNQ